MASHPLTADSPGSQALTQRARRRPRAWLACGVAIMLLAVGVLAAAERALYFKVERFDMEMQPYRPGGMIGAEQEPLDIGVLGVAQGRLVSVIMVHLDADRRGAAVWFLPDSQVGGLSAWHEAMPRVPDAGELAAVAQRIESATGQRLEHFAVFDWAAISELTANLGGVDVVLGPEGAKQHWPEALRLLPASVGEFVDRDECQAGDDSKEAETLRLVRQMVVMKTVMEKTLHQEFVRDPFSLYQTLDVLARNLAVDRTWALPALRSLVISLRHLRSRDIAYYVMGRGDDVVPSRTAVGRHAC